MAARSEKPRHRLERGGRESSWKGCHRSRRPQPRACPCTLGDKPPPHQINWMHCQRPAPSCQRRLMNGDPWMRRGRGCWPVLKPQGGSQCYLGALKSEAHTPPGRAMAPPVGAPTALFPPPRLSPCFLPNGRRHLLPPLLDQTRGKQRMPRARKSQECLLRKIQRQGSHRAPFLHDRNREGWRRRRHLPAARKAEQGCSVVTGTHVSNGRRGPASHRGAEGRWRQESWRPGAALDLPGTQVQILVLAGSGRQSQ